MKKLFMALLIAGFVASYSFAEMVPTAPAKDTDKTMETKVQDKDTKDAKAKGEKANLKSAEKKAVKPSTKVKKHSKKVQQ